MKSGLKILAVALSISAGAVGLGGTDADAAEVTFNFSGIFVAADPHTVGGIELTPPENPFANPSTITGSFTFESTTPDSNANSTIGQYNGALRNVSLTVTNSLGADYQFGFNSTGPLNSIQVNANATAVNQSYTVSASLRNVVPAGPLVYEGDDYQATQFFLTLIRPTSSVFGSDALPLTPPDHSLFALYGFPNNPNGQFRLVLDGHGDPHIHWGNLTSFAASPIPVPAAVYLFGTGLVGLVGLARRRR